MWKKTVIGVIVTLIVVGAAIFAVNQFKDKPSDNTETEIAQTETSVQEGENESADSTENTESTEGEPDKQNTPTFMYFVSNSDSDFDKTNEMLEELKKEYEGRVNFDIRNIDVTPEDKDNFPVDGNTPMLIMLDKSNDICAFNPNCSDKEALRTEIEATLQ